MASIQKTTYTDAEFDAIVNLPENADKILELIDGEIFEKMPTNPYCSIIAAIFVRLLGIFVAEHQLGYVTGADGLYILSKQHRFAPDAAFVSNERLPEIPRTGYARIAPDLAVEVISPTDLYTEVAKKVAAYLEFGTPLVWVVDPEMQTVAVHTSAGARTIGIDGELDGGDVLPGFTLAVKDIFPS